MVSNQNKQYRTRDGRKVRIYSTKTGHGFDQVHGAIMADWGWEMSSWGINGMKDLSGVTETFGDLIEVKSWIKRTYWVNIYDGTKHSSLFDAKADADLADKYTNLGNRIACVKVVIDCEEGEGL